MTDWKVVYTRQAVKDRERAYLAGYREKIVSILFVLLTFILIVIKISGNWPKEEALCQRAGIR